MDSMTRIAMVSIVIAGLTTAIYCFVVSMILIFANPFWNYAIAQAAGR